MTFTRKELLAAAKAAERWPKGNRGWFDLHFYSGWDRPRCWQLAHG